MNNYIPNKSSVITEFSQENIRDSIKFLKISNLVRDGGSFWNCYNYVCRFILLYIIQLLVSLHNANAIGSLSIEQAILIGLKNNTNIKVSESELCGQAARIETEQGNFDLLLSVQAEQKIIGTPLASTQQIPGSFGLLYQDDFTTTKTYSSNLAKLFAPGFRVTQFLSMTATHSNFNEILKKPTENRASIGFQIDMPLLKNRDVTASLDVEKLTQYSTYHDYKFVTATNIKNIIQAYWEAKGAELRLDILRKSEQSSEKLYHNIVELVKSKEVPEADLSLILADLYDRQSNRVNAEQNLVLRKVTLANLIGLPRENAHEILSLTSKFPSQKVNFGFDNHNITTAIEGALQKRDDLISTKYQVQGIERVIKTLRLNKYPAVNLQLSAGNNYLHEGGDVFSFSHGNSAKFYSGNVNFEFPVTNRTSRGREGAAAAQLNQLKYNLAELTRNIHLNIVSSLSSYNHLFEQFNLSVKSVDKYQESLNNELDKLALGEATLIDVLRVKDNLVNIELSLVSRQVGFASSIVELSFQTGELIYEKDKTKSLNNELVINSLFTGEQDNDREGLIHRKKQPG